MDLPTPNIPLLRKAVEWAEAEAAKTDGTCLWYQRDWVTQIEDCGTAYCIAGYAVTAVMPNAQAIPAPDEDGFAELRIDGEAADWMNVGAEVLGLTKQEALNLFEDTNRIADVRRVAEQIAARAGERL